MNKWNITKLMVIGSMAVLLVAFISIGSIINAITGITFAGGVINFLGVIILLLCPLLVRKFGAATIMGLVVSILALPLPVAGPPGFLLSKLIFFVSAGFIVDIIFLLLRRYEKLSVIIAGLVVGPTIGIMTVIFASLFSFPGAEKYIKFILQPPIVIGSFPLFAFLGYVAWLIYRKIKNTAIVERIQA